MQNKFFTTLLPLGKVGRGLFLFAILLLAACSSSDDAPAPEPVIPAQRTVIAFFDGNNNLHSSLSSDISEIEAGSKALSPTTNLILFANILGGKPYIAEVAGGEMKKVREWSATFPSVHPDSMLAVMKWIIEKYPAPEYGIIFGGHGTGSIVKSNSDKDTDTIPTTMRPAYADGWDFNTTPSQKPLLWINTGTLATVISHLPQRPRFVFFDCCLMQDIDVAYQLRNYIDYIIAPVSETPAAGAPYKDITPLLSITDPETLCDTILTTYQTYCQQKALPICISALRTYYVDDLMVKTNAALREVKQNLEDNNESYDYTNVIYYFRETDDGDPVLYDVKSFLYEQNKSGRLSDPTYQAFLAALKPCIFTSRKSNGWRNANNRIHFTDFTVTDDNYGALSVSRATIEK